MHRRSSDGGFRTARATVYTSAPKIFPGRDSTTLLAGGGASWTVRLDTFYADESGLGDRTAYGKSLEEPSCSGVALRSPRGLEWVEYKLPGMAPHLCAYSPLLVYSRADLALTQ
jgi:hypothetical protein